MTIKQVVKFLKYGGQTSGDWNMPLDLYRPQRWKAAVASLRRLQRERRSAASGESKVQVRLCRVRVRILKYRRRWLVWFMLRINWLYPDWFQMMTAVIFQYLLHTGWSSNSLSIRYESETEKWRGKTNIWLQILIFQLPCYCPQIAQNPSVLLKTDLKDHQARWQQPFQDWALLCQ